MGEVSKPGGGNVSGEPPPEICCSFCAKQNSEVLAMFARPSGARICNECVAAFAHELALRQQGG